MAAKETEDRYHLEVTFPEKLMLLSAITIREEHCVALNNRAHEQGSSRVYSEHYQTQLRELRRRLEASRPSPQPDPAAGPRSPT